MVRSDHRKTEQQDIEFCRLALGLARKGWGKTSPNPMVGAVITRNGEILGRGWHRAAGRPHAEIEAFLDARRQGFELRGATLYVTLEPCSTHGRTPPCTEAIIAAGIRRVVACTSDPNPSHRGRGFRQLLGSGIEVQTALLANEANRLNETFNHWIVHHLPWVTLKAGMTLDGKIATHSGESQWITSPASRRVAMRWREHADAILAGIGTVLKDNPSLTVRSAAGIPRRRQPRRVVLDPNARIPATSRLLQDAWRRQTLIVAGPRADTRRISQLAEKVDVWIAPLRQGWLDLGWVLRRLGEQQITHLLVEGGGNTHAAFLEQGLAHRLVFFYAPRVLGGRHSRRAVAGAGADHWNQIWQLEDPEWKRAGPDLWVTARLARAKPAS